MQRRLPDMPTPRHGETTMKQTFLAVAVSTGVLSLSQPATADFLADSKAGLEARNFYFNRDFRHICKDNRPV